MKAGKILAFVFVFLSSFLLFGCDALEKTAYQVLARTQAEHKVIQRYCSEAAVHNLIDQKQWDRFNVISHTFIKERNNAVDAFELWQRKKTKENEARLRATLSTLPAIIQRVEDFGKGCKQRLDAQTFTP